MQRLVFEVGGHLVRLSANICQLHRPNTIPIFCAAVCRDYRLRTFIAIAFKFLFLKGDDFSRIQDQLLIKRQLDGLIQLIHPVPDKRL